MICEEGDAPEAVNKTIVEGDRLTGKRLGHVQFVLLKVVTMSLLLTFFVKVPATSHLAPLFTIIYCVLFHLLLPS